MHIAHATENPLTELTRINKVRAFIDGPDMPFKMCYDLDFKSLDFYLIPTEIDDLMRPLLAGKREIIWSEDSMRQNMIKDVKDVGVLNNDTRLPENAVMMDRETVINYMAQY